MQPLGIHHVGVAVANLDEAVESYALLLGGTLEHREVLPDQGVEAASMLLGGSRIELLAPTDQNTPVGRFIAKRGPGMHHIAYEVEDVRDTLADLAAAGAELIDVVPRLGLFGLQVAFVHPDAVHGVLTEVVSIARST
jgi:methylmalonyl-CoA/ethylmalonyl-CoA epimerase